MKSDKVLFHSMDEYIATFPPETQTKLQELRTLIKSAAPDVQETIKYHMPTFVWNGNLLHFAAWKNHIGFYGVPNAPDLQEELSRYAGPKGSLKFALDKPLPTTLIRKLVKLRLAQNLKNSKAPTKQIKER